MATQSREPTLEEELEGGLLGQIEVHSIDWIPDTERHGKTWQQTMLWFLGNFQYFTIPIGSVGPAPGPVPFPGPDRRTGRDQRQRAGTPGDRRGQPGGVR